jgi:hypothetical protein
VPNDDDIYYKNISRNILDVFGILKSLIFYFENTRINVDFKIVYLLLKTQTLYAQYIK